MSVNGVSSGTNTFTSSKDVIENPKGQLQKDAFLKLFLEELKHQDPTAPMDADKILTQTSQLTTLEAQEEQKKAMQSITEAMISQQASNAEWVETQGEMKAALEAISQSLGASSENGIFNKYNAVSMIGKMVETDVKGVKLTSNESQKFELYFDREIDGSKPGAVAILDDEGNIVRSMPLSSLDGKKGLISFEWDTRDNEGKYVAPNKEYNIVAEYNLDEETGQVDATRIGRGKVDSVLYNSGEPMLKIGSLVLPLNSAVEFYQ